MVLAWRVPLVDGDGEPVVSKEEATHGAALDERRSTGEARGKRGRSGGSKAEA
jgi:hypothetical protein